MTSRTSCFERTIFLRDIKRSAPLWVLYLLFLLALMPFEIYASFGTHEYVEPLRIVQRILATAEVGASAIPFVYGAIAAWILFFYLFQTKSTYFYAALPIRRETIFLTHYFAGLTIGIVPNALCGLVTYGVASSLGVHVLVPCLQWLAISSMGYFFFFSFAVLLCNVVAQLAAMPILYIVLNFTAIVLEAIIRALLESFVYGIPTTSSNLLTQKFSPVYYMLNIGKGFFGSRGMGATEANNWTVTHYIFKGWDYLFALCIAGIIFTVCAFLLYRKRDMERSGDVVAVRWLRPVFQVVFTLGCALVIAQIVKSIISSSAFSYDFFVVLFLLLLGALIGHIAARMMLKKTLRVFKDGWKSYFICCAVLIVVFGAIGLDVTGFSRTVPKAEDVESVTLATYYYSYGEEGQVNEHESIEATIALHQYLVDNRKAVLDARDDAIRLAESHPYLTIIYFLRDGTQLARSFPISDVDRVRELQDMTHNLYNSTPFVLARALPETELNANSFVYCNIDCYEYETEENGTALEMVKATAEPFESSNISLGSHEAWEFYSTCVLPDLKDSTLGHDYFPRYEYENQIDGLDINISFRYNTGAEDETGHIVFTVTSDAKRTLAYLQELGLITNVS